MNVQEFVETSLVQIMQGVQAAQKKFPFDHGLMPVIGSTEGTQVHAREGGTIHFDVAVTTAASGSVEGSLSASGGVKVVGVDLLRGEAGATLTGEASRSVVSRLVFEIPVTWPGQPEVGRTIPRK